MFNIELEMIIYILFVFILICRNVAHSLLIIIIIISYIRTFNNILKICKIQYKFKTSIERSYNLFNRKTWRHLTVSMHV